MTRFFEWAAMIGVALASFGAAETASADNMRAVQTEAGVLIANYRAGNIPPADAHIVLPGERWTGWLELDSDRDVKFYIENDRYQPGDRPWRQYRAFWFQCGEEGDEKDFVAVTVDYMGLAVVSCRGS